MESVPAMPMTPGASVARSLRLPASTGMRVVWPDESRRSVLPASGLRHLLRSLLAADDDGGELVGLGARHLDVGHEAVFVGLALDGGLERRHAEVGDAEGVGAAAVGEDDGVLALGVRQAVSRYARLGRGDFDAGVLEREGVGSGDAAEDDVGGGADLGVRGLQGGTTPPRQGRRTEGRRRCMCVEDGWIDRANLLARWLRHPIRIEGWPR